MQTTDTILLVRPYLFRKNEETAINNYFQSEEIPLRKINQTATSEFDNFASLLQHAGIRTIVIQDNGKHQTPDSIFPNHVVSFHGDSAILYPMFAYNRRRERNLNYLGQLKMKGFEFEKLNDYSVYEESELFLEGNGALILDRVHRIAYISLSDRAHENLAIIFCNDHGYEPVIFQSFHQFDTQLKPIFHSNMMMSLGTNFCVICWDCIPDIDARIKIEQRLIKTNKEIITISMEQMHQFAGNMVEIKNKKGHPFICMSTRAFDSLTTSQKIILSRHGMLLHAPLYNIEKFGGGSARCMIAEVFYKNY